jgi:Domain of unknown function (DUF3859)
MKGTLIGTILGLCMCTAVPVAYAGDAPSGRITSYGIYAYSLDNAHSTQSGSNTTYTQVNPILAVTSDYIPLLKGIYFGYKFKLDDLPSDTTVDLTWTVKHPPMHKPDGSTDTGYSLVRKVHVDRGSITGISGYILSDDDELVPGDWTLTYSYNGKVLIGKTFHVVDIGAPR